MADELIASLSLSVEVMQTIPKQPASGVRDPKDEYLVDHAIAADVDYLVTGDRDLLELEHHFRFRAVTPSQFVALLEPDPTDSGRD